MRQTRMIWNWVRCVNRKRDIAIIYRKQQCGIYADRATTMAPIPSVDTRRLVPSDLEIVAMGSTATVKLGSMPDLGFV